MSVHEDRHVEASTDVVASLLRQIENLEVAVDRRTVIGQAQGILMARLDVDADTAFRYLTRVSMSTNRKLGDLAEEVARTRTLPAVDH